MSVPDRSGCAGRRPPRCRDHGDFTAGCPACRAWAAWYGRLRHRLLETGQWQRMRPVDKARAHIAALRAAGMRPMHIAERAGISPRALNHIAAGYVAEVHPDTEAAVCGVRVELRPTSFVPAVAMARQVQALAFLGRGMEWTAARSGVSRRIVSEVARGLRPRVLAATADAIAAVYEAHAGHRVGETREERNSHRLAVARGWHSSDAWGDDIDDPAAVPYGWCRDLVDVVKIRRVLAGGLGFDVLSDAERLALFRDHHGGRTSHGLEQLLRIPRGVVAHWRTVAAGSDGVAA